MGSSETMNVGTRTTCISHISSADIMGGNNNKKSKQYEHTISIKLSKNVNSGYCEESMHM